MRRRLTYANVISTLALVLALGGVSYAVTQLPPNSVGTAQLKRHAVTPAKLSSAVNKSFRLHCRGGTRAALGVCFETRERPNANFYVAADRCESLGGRLPTVAEMEAAQDVHGLLPSPAKSEMTGDVTFDNSNGPEYLIAPRGLVNVGFRPQTTNTPFRYRCVFARSN